MSTQDTRTQVIAGIADQMRQYGITLAELARTLEEGNNAPEGRRDIFTRLCALLGGIFVFAGVAAYISMFWSEMNAAMHIIVTLGVGLALQGAAIALLSNDHYRRIAPPLLVLALVMQPTGWFVAIDEWFPHGHEPRYAVLFVMSIMAIQQGAIFSRHRLTLLLGAAICFAYAAAFTLLSLLDASEKLSLVGMGISAIAVAHALRPTPHGALSRLGDFAGSIMFYCGAFDLLRHTDIELLYLGLTCGMMYLSAHTRSGTLLATSTIAMLSYIGYFTAEHFVHSVGWPVALILLGIVFFAISSFALRIRKRYIAG